jgi:hypothetical protein
MSTKWTTLQIIEDETKGDQRYDKFDTNVQKLANEFFEQFGDTIMVS